MAHDETLESKLSEKTKECDQLHRDLKRLRMAAKALRQQYVAQKRLEGAVLSPADGAHDSDAVEGMVSRIRELEEQLERKGATCRELRDRENRHEQTVSKEQEATKNIRHEVNELKTDIERLSEQNEMLQESVSSEGVRFSHARERFQKDRREYKLEIEKLQLAHDRLTENQNSLTIDQEMLQKLKASVTKYQVERDNLLESGKQVKADLEHTSKLRAKLETNVKQLQADLSASHKKNEACHVAATEQDGKISALKQAADIHLAESKTWKNRFDERQNELHKLENENEDWMATIERLEHKRVVFRKRLRALNDEKKILREECERLKVSHYESVEKARATISSIRDKAKSENQRLLDLSEQRANNVSDLSDKLETVEKVCMCLKEENEQTRVKHTELIANIEKGNERELVLSSQVETLQTAEEVQEEERAIAVLKHETVRTERDQLLVDIENMENKRAELLFLLAEASEKTQAAEKATKAIQAEVDLLQQDNESEQRTREFIADQKRILEQKYLDLQQELKEAATEHEQVLQARQKAETDLEEERIQLEGVRAEKAIADTAIIKMEEDFLVAVEEQEQAQIELEKWELKLDDKVAEKDLLLARLDELENENGWLTMENNRVDKAVRVALLVADQEEAQKDIVYLRETLKGIRRQLEAGETMRSENGEQLKALETQLTDLANANRLLQADLSERQKTMQGMEAAIADYEEKTNRFNELETLVTDAEVKKNQAESRLVLSDELLKNSDKKNRKSGKWKYKFKEARAERDAAQQALEKIRHMLSVLQVDLAKNVTALGEREAEITGLKSTILNLENAGSFQTKNATESRLK